MKDNTFEEKLVKLFNDCVDIKDEYEAVEDFYSAAGLCYCLDIINRLLREIEKEFMR